MGLATLLYKLGSPYDAYIAHVSELNSALSRLRYMSDRALGLEAGLHGSVRIVPGGEDRELRVQRFREQLGQAAASMSDEQFEDFVAHLGGGEAADVEANRARVVDRMSVATRGFQEYFAIAGKALATLEERGYNPNRADVARQLRENNLPSHTIAEYRSILRALGTKVGLQHD